MPIYLRPSGGRVELTVPVAGMLRDFARGAQGPEEAGGVLLGRLVIDSDDIVIDKVTEPGIGDKRKAFTFWRSKSSHQKQVNKSWTESKGTQIYLGEWHSHPEAIPTPSGHDECNWAAIMKKAKFEQDALLFVIAGYDAVRLWQIGRGQKAPVELTLQR